MLSFTCQPMARRARPAWRRLAVILPLLMASTSAAAEPKGAASALLSCRAITASEARLACFDRAAADLAGEIAGGEVRVLDREEVKAAERATFGLAPSALGAALTGPAPAPTAAAASPAPAPAEPAPLDRIEAKVVRADPTPTGMMSVALDDGSLWRTTEASRTFLPKAGDPITIERGAIGSYLASTPNSRAVRIKRVR